jgi:hypothetical protein
MNLEQLKTAVYGYLQVDFPGVERHALLSNGTITNSLDRIDILFIQAANNARRHAELRHDWQCAEVTLEGAIPTDQSGLSWDAMTGDDGLAVPLRQIRFVYVVDDDGAMMPVTVVKKSRASKIKFDKKKVRTIDYHGENCHPAKVVHWARKFYTDPANEVEPINLVVEGYRDLAPYVAFGSLIISDFTSDIFTDIFASSVWVKLTTLSEGRVQYAWYNSTQTGVLATLKWSTADVRWEVAVNVDGTYVPYCWNLTDVAIPDLTTGLWLFDPLATGFPLSLEFTFSLHNQTDYFLTRGFNYMMYAAVVELNMLIQRFVFRQEGTVQPPIKERDEALEMLIRDDVYSTEGGDWSDLDDE